MNIKSKSKILIAFLIFFIGYSIIDVFLSFKTTTTFTNIDIIRISINLIQIISILLIFMSKKIGVYGFYLVRVLNIISLFFISMNFYDITVEIINNIIIAVVFYILLKDRDYEQ